MNNQSNTEKILKLIDKFDVHDLTELHGVLKDYMTKKAMSKSTEHSEIAAKFLSQATNISGG